VSPQTPSLSKIRIWGEGGPPSVIEEVEGGGGGPTDGATRALPRPQAGESDLSVKEEGRRRQRRAGEAGWQRGGEYESRKGR
jgi:hypothetical protein